ncbi:hypothetical protein PM082_022712 [Marasmius tenuissimus]|nr:hypothetical protein PM082_022250 [Marasmius tenuissimus]KAJ8095820.1 hypothetical protein PM082_022712 [Marasmius tenuissimus]
MSLNQSSHAPNGASLSGGGSSPDLPSCTLPPNQEWVYIKLLGQMAHRQSSCQCCQTFIGHCSDSIRLNCEAYEQGLAQRDKIIAEPYTLQLEAIRAEKSQVEAELSLTRNRLRSAERHIDNLAGDLEDLRDTHNKVLSELESTQEEIEHLREFSTRHKEKKRRIDDGESTPVTQPESQMPDSMDVDNEGGPVSVKTDPVPTTTYSRDNPPWDDGRYRTAKQFEVARRHYESGLPPPKTDEDGKPLPRRWAAPKTVKEVSQLFARLKKSETSSQPNIRLFEFIKGLYSDATKVPKDQRSDIHNAILQGYYRPAFVGKKGGKSTTAPVSMDAVDTSVPATTGTPANNSKVNTTSNSLSAAPNATKRVPQPPKHAELKEIIPWLKDERLHLSKPRNGVRFPNGGLSVRCARGVQLWYQCSPPHRKGLSPMHRHQFQFTFMELALTPGYYSNYVATNPLPDVAGPLRVKPYAGDFANVNIRDLAEFFRSQSIPVSDIHDTAYFAACWLADVTFTDDESNFALNELRAKLLPLLVTHGIPAGYNENIHHSDDRIESLPSAVSFDIPGATQVSSLSSSTTSTSAGTDSAPTTPTNPTISNVNSDANAITIDCEGTATTGGTDTPITTSTTEAVDIPAAMPESKLA